MFFLSCYLRFIILSILIVIFIQIRITHLITMNILSIADFQQLILLKFQLQVYQVFALLVLIVTRILYTTNLFLEEVYLRVSPILQKKSNLAREYPLFLECLLTF